MTSHITTTFLLVLAVYSTCSSAQWRPRFKGELPPTLYPPAPCDRDLRHPDFPVTGDPCNRNPSPTKGPNRSGTKGTPPPRPKGFLPPITTKGTFPPATKGTTPIPRTKGTPGTKGTVPPRTKGTTPLPRTKGISMTKGTTPATTVETTPITKRTTLETKGTTPLLKTKGTTQSFRTKGTTPGTKGTTLYPPAPCDRDLRHPDAPPLKGDPCNRNPSGAPSPTKGANIPGTKGTTPPPRTKGTTPLRTKGTPLTKGTTLSHRTKGTTPSSLRTKGTTPPPSTKGTTSTTKGTTRYPEAPCDRDLRHPDAPPLKGDPCRRNRTPGPPTGSKPPGPPMPHPKGYRPHINRPSWRDAKGDRGEIPQRSYRRFGRSSKVSSA